MGFEFRLVLTAEELCGKAGDMDGISACFEQIISVEVYRVTVSSIARAYAFALPFRREWPEDFVMQLDKDGWYLCFHSATDFQQTTVLQTLTQCLHTLGITGEFEEL